MKRHVIIAGAGCAGLAAALSLQKRGFHVTVCEKSNRVGGLAGGIELNGNIYEYGPHIFHTTDPEVLEDVKRVAGHVLIKFEKSIKIKFLGKYFSFPLEIRDVLFKLPLLTILHAGGSLVYYSLIGLFQGRQALVNSEKVLQRSYGDVLYKIFFKDYITKVWGIEPKGMAPSFAAQRIPRLEPLAILHRIKQRLLPAKPQEISTSNYVEKVTGENFTTKKGFYSIAEAYATELVRNGGTLLLETSIIGAETLDNLVRAVQVKDKNGQTQSLSCDYVVSTLPISLAPRLFQQTPERVLHAAQELKFRGILFVGLLIKRQNVLPASFMYFRDKSFNRITDLAQFKVEIKPKGSTLLIAEVMCQPEDIEWQQEQQSIQKVIRELVDEQLISEDEIIESHAFKSEFGYPIYKVGYEEALGTVTEHLSTYQNFFSIGRQGKFAYINTHVAFKMGYEAARAIEHHASTRAY